MTNNIDKGWFRLQKLSSRSWCLYHFLDKNNIDLNDYYIIKITDTFRLLNNNEIEKYAGVVCFHKDVYSLESINKWIEFCITKIKIIKFVTNPFPPEYMIEKIKVVEW